MKRTLAIQQLLEILFKCVCTHCDEVLALAQGVDMIADAALLL